MGAKAKACKLFKPRRLPGNRPLKSRYKNFRVLGHGAQGDLYMARDQLNDGAWVAIKFLAQNPSEMLVDYCGVSGSSRFDRHFELLAKLFEGEVRTHTRLALAGVPNIPRVAEKLDEYSAVPRWDGSKIRLKDGISFNPGRTPYFGCCCRSR